MRCGTVGALLLAGCGGISISSDFEGGSLGAARVVDGRWMCPVPGQADHEGRNRQITWYFFRIDGARGRRVDMTLTDLEGEYDYRPGAVGITDATPPVVSTDREHWTHLEAAAFDKSKKQLSYSLTAGGDSVWVAHVEPYTASRLEEFLKPIPKEIVGRSVEGRPIYLLTITNPAIPDEKKRVVWLMTRQHAWESGTSFAGEGAIKHMLSDEARELRDRVVFKIFPMLDPDGCAHGGVRFNRNGFDVNRNWDTADERRMPEIWHARKTMNAWLDSGRPIHLFVTLHNTETVEYLSGADPIGARLFRLLKDSSTFDPNDPGPRIPRDKPAPGRASVVDFVEPRAPAFLIEQRISFNPRLGRHPTSTDRIEFGAQLARAMCRAALQE